jgi:hypothetical protein
MSLFHPIQMNFQIFQTPQNLNMSKLIPSKLEGGLQPTLESLGQFLLIKIIFSKLFDCNDISLGL